MKQSLQIRHSYKGKFVRTYRLTRAQTSLGSYKLSGIHLLGDQIAGLACLIEKTNKGWRIIDLGSEPEVRADHKPFTEIEIKSRSVLEIGANKLELQVSKEARAAFSGPNNDIDGGRNVYYVAKWNDKIFATSFEKAELASLKSPNVEIVEYKMSKKKNIANERVSVPEDLRKPLFGSFVTFLVFIFLLIGIPSLRHQDPEKPKDNVYTRMIYDSKILTERKKQMQSSGTKMFKGLSGNNQNQAAFKKNVVSESKAVANLRQAGISSIIGKIAKQASKSVLMVAKLAAMPQADASINNGEKMNTFGKMSPTQGASGKADILGGAGGFKVGAIGTAGKGGGNGGYKSGNDLGDGGVGHGNIAIDDAETTVEGGLEKEVIARIIREHLGQIRYCYDRQLASDSGLHGKVKVNFSIDAEGMVDTQAVGESTMNSAMIDECILRRIATWKFPKPKGGTKVLVSYPFLFQSVN